VTQKGKIFISFLLIFVFLFTISKANTTTQNNMLLLSPNGDKITYGSSYWQTSNIREWLNSAETVVNYTNQKPSSDKLGNYAYDTEPGFLSEFTQDEINAIAVTAHRVPISVDDQSVSNGGNAQMPLGLMLGQSISFCVPNILTSWQSYIYQVVNDKVYFLSPYELYLFVQKRGFSLNRSVTNAVKNKYNYLNGNIPWWLSGGAASLSIEYSYISSPSSAVTTTRPSSAYGVVPVINLKPDYKLSNGELASNLKIGETVTFGRHLGESINWIVINKLNGYPMLLAENAIDIKPLDAPGDYSYAYSNYINFPSADISYVNPVYVSTNGSSDTTPPVITILNEDQLNTRQNDSFTINLSVTDDSGVSFVQLPDGSKTTSTNISYTITANGTYLFIASDINGNYKYLTVPVSNINVPPFVNISSSANGWTNKDVTVNISASNDVGLDASSIIQSGRDWNGSIWANYTTYKGKQVHITADVELVSATQDVGNYKAGIGFSYYYTWKNGDEYQEAKTWQYAYQIPLSTLQSQGKQHIDVVYTIPSNYFQDLQPWTQIDIPFNLQGVYTIKWTNVHYELLDNSDFAIKEIILPSGQIVYQNSYTDTLTKEGQYTYTVIDNHGATTQKTITVLIDKVPPTLNISGIPQTLTNLITLTISASDDRSGVAYITLPNGSTTTSTSTTFNIRANGLYTFKVTDNAGNITTQTVTINTINNVSYNNMNTVYKAGQAIIIDINCDSNVDNVTARMWYANNEFIDSNTTNLIKGLNGEWHTAHNSSEGYDKVVIIPKDMPDGTYNITITVYKTINGITYTQSIIIPITVKGTIYDYYHSEINN